MKRLIALAAAAMLLPACAAIEYYAQAVGGHLELLRLSVPIEEALHQPNTPEAVRARLEHVVAIRNFASRELKLPDNGSYRRYADIGRPFVIWNVFAAPEFSVKAVESCFPFAGCVTYRGYYSEEGGQRHAARMAAEGNDVYIGGVPAYSTLGWFDDPVLSTFIRYPDAELARLLFHELAHQVVYVKDDTMFNESFAVAVEEEGVRRWLDSRGTPEQRAAHESFTRRRQQIVALVLKYRTRLEAFYGEPGSAEEKRAGKERRFDEMLSEYRALKDSWDGYAGYDRLFGKRPNNALLASIAAYTELVPAFRALLAAGGGDMERFYAAARKLAAMPAGERRMVLGAPPLRGWAVSGEAPASSAASPRASRTPGAASGARSRPRRFSARAASPRAHTSGARRRRWEYRPW
jgi:predicted aminopeptidase